MHRTASLGLLLSLTVAGLALHTDSAAAADEEVPPAPEAKVGPVAREPGPAPDLPEAGQP